MSCLWNVHPVWLFKCIQSLSYLIGMNIKRTIGRAYCTRLAVPVSVSVSIIIPNCEEKKTTNGMYITTQVSGFIPPSHQLKLGAFCALEEVISWGDAGGGVLEIDQWQICDSGSQQLEMMKLFSFFFFYTGSVSPPAHTYTSSHTWSHSSSLHVPTDGQQTQGSRGRTVFSLFVPSSCPRRCRNSRSSWVLKKAQDQGWVLPSKAQWGQRPEHLGLLRTRSFRLSQHSQPLYQIFFEVSVFAASCPLLYKSQRCDWTSKTTS